MEWIIAGLVGLVIGWAAYALMGDQEVSPSWNFIIGILGGLLGKWLLSYAWVVGNYTVGDNFNLYSVLWGLVGAVVVVLGARLFLEKPAS